MRLRRGTWSSAPSSSARSRRSSTSLAQRRVRLGARARTASARTGTSSGAARAAATAACPATRTCTLTQPGEHPARRSPATRTASARRCCASSAAFEPVLQGLLWAAVLGVVLYLNWGERRVRRLFYLGGLVFRRDLDARQGPAGFGLPDARARSRTSRVAPERGRLARLQRSSRSSSSRSSAGCSSSSRSRCPGTSRCTCATGRRSPTGSSSTTCSTARSTTCTTRTRATTRASASTSGSSATRSSRGRGSRRSGSCGGCGGATRRRTGQGDASVLLCMWFLFAFALFSFMGTKFHHYIFPAVPPVAMLIGIVLDDMLGRGAAAPRRGGARRVPRRALVGGVVADGPRRSRGCCRARSSGRSPTGDLGEPVARRWASVLLVVRASAMRRRRSSLAVPRPRARAPTRRPATPATEAGGRRRTRRVMLGGGRGRRARCCSSLVGARSRHQARGRRPAGRDPAAPALHVQLPARLARLARLLGGARRRSRSSASVLIAGARGARGAAARGRRDRARSRSSGRVWGLDVYMEKTAPHWGQHEVIEAYYANRASPGRAARRLPDELEGRELLHRQPHPGVRLDRRRPSPTWLKKQRDEGGEGHVLHHRARAHRRAQERGAGARRTARSPTRP